MKYFGILLLGLSTLFVLQGCATEENYDHDDHDHHNHEHDHDEEVKEPQDIVPAVEEDSLEIVEDPVDEVKEEIAAVPAGETKVLIETDFGDMEAVLYDSTPGHRDNFVKLVGEGFYDGLLFHRVIQGFMIQGGDPNSLNAPSNQRLGSGGPGYQIPAEIGAPHIKGTLAAARLGGPSNPQKESSGSQFYISQGAPVTAQGLAQSEAQKGITYTQEQKQKYLDIGGVPMLDAEYTVFGEVTSGLEVIDKIAAVQTAPGDRPLEDVSMKISVLK